MWPVWILVLSFTSLSLCIEHDFKGFDDSILFRINWPGAPEQIENLIDEGVDDAGKPQVPEHEILKVSSSAKEIYECRIPQIHTEKSNSVKNYDGPTPLNILKPLFSQKICSYRLESYWSYEVCHGRYVRQYHEERDGKYIKTQDYYLGHWNMVKQMKLEVEMKISQEAKEKPMTTKVEGVALPSVEMVMDDGTICDLSGKPRLTRVKYVCYALGKHEVYSFKETATCEYEIIILSPLLCEHPQFRIEELRELDIDCIPKGDAPKKPWDVLRNEFESLKLRHQSIKLVNDDKKDHKDILTVLKVEKIEKDGETHLKFEVHSLGDGEQEDNKLKLIDDKPSAIADDTPVRAFLNGENCLNGGTGWWKYEFCYGKHVTQYHEDRSGERTTLLLGKFNEADHLAWIKENKAKAPKPAEVRTSVSHFYGNGDECDKTGKPRQTEVKLKCLENASSTAQVSLYLLEPRTCHYILGVESPLICDILPLADENGLIKPKEKVVDKNVIDENEQDKNEEEEDYMQFGQF